MYRIVSINDENNFNEYKVHLDINQVFYLPGYLNLSAIYEDAKAYAFVYESREGYVYYPFLLNNIDKNLIKNFDNRYDYYDISSQYGYGGPIIKCDSSNKSKILQNFRREFESFCNKNNIVAEFTRFNPGIKNHEEMEKYMVVDKVNEIVYVDLNKSLEQIWKDYKYSNRKCINKAKNNNIEIFFEDTPNNFKSFYSIYKKTMDRNKADKYYYFSTQYFNNIHEYLKGHYLYFYAMKDNEFISTELVLYDDNYCYSFLGGTLDNYFQYSPNNLLKHEIIKQLKKMGVKSYVLGGGHKLHDGIYEYKKAFSPNSIEDFYIGKKIHNEKVYSYLINQWELKNNKDANLFLQYKY